MGQELPMAGLQAHHADSSTEGRKVFRFSWRPALLVLGLSGGLYVAVSVVQRGFSLAALVLFAVISLPVSAYFASLALRVKLVVDGHAITFDEGGKSTTVTWENLHGVSVGNVAGRKGVRHYKLFSMNQVVMEFENEISDSERAYRTIERKLSVALYPRFKAAIDRGETVTFGLVSLSAGQLGVRHLTLSMGEARLARQAGSVALCRRNSLDPLVIIDEGDVQNMNILLRCLGEIDARAIGSAFTVKD